MNWQETVVLENKLLLMECPGFETTCNVECKVCKQAKVSFAAGAASVAREIFTELEKEPVWATDSLAIYITNKSWYQALKKKY